MNSGIFELCNGVIREYKTQMLQTECSSLSRGKDLTDVFELNEEIKILYFRIPEHDYPAISEECFLVAAARTQR